jgi:dTDP-4-amino-4,6-dideoxygalactose transaminase
VLSEQRERLAAGLASADVDSHAYYATPLHRQPALERYAPEGELPGAERAAAMSLALPMGPALSDAEVATVATAVRTVLA